MRAVNWVCRVAVRAVNWACYHVAWVLATNNRRCLLLWIFASVLLAVAFASGPGEPVLVRLVQDQTASLERTIKAQNSWWWGSVAAIQEGPSLFWSWWPWIRFFLVLAAALIYTPIAFREEAVEAWVRVSAWLREREDQEAGSRGATPPFQPVVRSHSFWQLLRVDLIAEFVSEFARLIAGSIIRRQR